MDLWTLALRGDDDAQLEFRASFGPPVGQAGAVELYRFGATTRVGAAHTLDALANTLQHATTALVHGGDRGDEERAAALCVAAREGEFIVARDAAKRLAPWLHFTRALARRGWRLPLSAVSFAATPRLRDDVRATAATLPSVPTLVGRDDDVSALVDGLTSGDVRYMVLRADVGMGASRCIREAATRVGATLTRIVFDGNTLSHEVLDAVTITQRDTVPSWVCFEASEPITSLDVDLDAMRARLAGVPFIVMVAPHCDTPWCDPAREVELGPLAPAESRSLVRALLGDAIDDTVVVDLARRGGGAPRNLVTAVHLAVVASEFIAGPWRARTRRTLPLPSRRRDDAPLRRLAREDKHDVLRACEAAAALGDGASVYALQAVLHAAMASTITVDDLVARGFLSVVDDQVDLGRSFTAAIGVDDALRGRLAALRLSGALDVMTSAELAVDCGAPDAATQLCHAARAALSSGDVAVAVRLAARAAATHNVSDDLVSATLRVVASTVGTALTIRIIEGSTPTVVDLSTVEATARAREIDGDDASAARLRALAALLQGNATPAVLVGHGARSVRDQILGALGLARTGDLRNAVHVAAIALAWARHDNDARGISASLSLLASLYAALERFDEAARFTEASRAVGG